jgi:hypothetical protein
MKISLYQANELASLELFVDDDGVVDMEGWENAKMVVADKQRAVCAFIKNQSAGVSMLETAIASLLEKKRVIEAQQERLKAYLLENMKEHGVKEIKALDGTFSATISYLRDSELVWTCETADIPMDFKTIKTVATPSKTLAKEAILRGEPVSCAVLTHKDRLTIK